MVAGAQKMKRTQPKPFIVGPYLPGIDVMVYSNDAGFIDHHRAILLSIGFAPITATSVEMALAILRLMAIELVIVDGETGVPETRRIVKQARREGRHVPVVVVGRKSDEESRRQALELGAVDYLDHPAMQDDVVRAILPDRPLTRDSLWGPQQN